MIDPKTDAPDDVWMWAQEGLARGEILDPRQTPYRHVYVYFPQHNRTMLVHPRRLFSTKEEAEQWCALHLPS